MSKAAEASVSVGKPKYNKANQVALTLLTAAVTAVFLCALFWATGVEWFEFTNSLWGFGWRLVLLVVMGILAASWGKTYYDLAFDESADDGWESGSVLSTSIKMSAAVSAIMSILFLCGMWWSNGSHVVQSDEFRILRSGATAQPGERVSRSYMRPGSALISARGFLQVNGAKEGRVRTVYTLNAILVPGPELDAQFRNQGMVPDHRFWRSVSDGLEKRGDLIAARAPRYRPGDIVPSDPWLKLQVTEVAQQLE